MSPDEKNPGITAWFMSDNPGVRYLSSAICAIIIAGCVAALVLMLGGCAEPWQDPTCDADGDCRISLTGGGAFAYELNDPEHGRGAGWAGIKIKFDSPL
jgi:hypothetical protein